MMLASRLEDFSEISARFAGEMFVEYKYDGERVQVHKDKHGTMRAFSRRLEDITHQYPEVVVSLRPCLKATDGDPGRRGRCGRFEDREAASLRAAHAAEAQSRR